MTFLRILYKLCQALSFLHSHHILHRDVKLENVLIDFDLTPRLTDFGMSLVIPTPDTTDVRCDFRGTHMYAAPEIMKCNKHCYSTKSDIWALGVLFLEIFTVSSNNLDFERLRQCTDSFLIETIRNVDSLFSLDSKFRHNFTFSNFPIESFISSFA